jgi:hypothetical protein
VTYEIVSVGSTALGVIVSDVAVAVKDLIMMTHGSGGSEVVGCGAVWVGGKDVEFPYTVISCVTVSVALDAI